MIYSIREPSLHLSSATRIPGFNLSYIEIVAFLESWCLQTDVPRTLLHHLILVYSNRRHSTTHAHTAHSNTNDTIYMNNPYLYLSHVRLGQVVGPLDERPRLALGQDRQHEPVARLLLAEPEDADPVAPLVQVLRREDGPAVDRHEAVPALDLVAERAG